MLVLQNKKIQQVIRNSAVIAKRLTLDVVHENLAIAGYANEVTFLKSFET